MNMVPVYAILGLFGLMFIYGIYLQIRGEKCPKCGEKVDDLGDREWNCRNCGHHIWL